MRWENCDLIQPSDPLPYFSASFTSDHSLANVNSDIGFFSVEAGGSEGFEAWASDGAEARARAANGTGARGSVDSISAVLTLSRLICSSETNGDAPVGAPGRAGAENRPSNGDINDSAFIGWAGFLSPMPRPQIAPRFPGATGGSCCWAFVLSLAPGETDGFFS